MTDEAQAAIEVAPEVVQPETETVTEPEAVESTEGQIEDQPAEAEAEEKKSASKQRRERRKAELERLREELRITADDRDRTQTRLDTLKSETEQQPPRLEDYNDPDDYLAAKSAYFSMQALDKRQIKDLEAEAETRTTKVEGLRHARMQEAQANWDAQREDARVRYADFDDVITAPDVAITQSMAEIMAMSDVGADVAYHLGTNKDIARVVAGMNPDQQQGAMAMLERHVSVSTPRTKTKTDAPEPVTPVRPKAVGSKDPAKMSMAEYKAARAAGKI